MLRPTIFYVKIISVKQPECNLTGSLNKAFAGNKVKGKLNEIKLQELQCFIKNTNCQEETGKDGQLCTGESSGHCGGGGRQENGSQALIPAGQRVVSPPLHDTLSALCSSFSDRLLHPFHHPSFLQRSGCTPTMASGRPLHTYNNKGYNTPGILLCAIYIYLKIAVQYIYLHL